MFFRWKWTAVLALGLLVALGCDHDLTVRDKPCQKDGDCTDGKVCRFHKCVPLEAGLKDLGGDLADAGTDAPGKDTRPDVPPADKTNPDNAVTPDKPVSLDKPVSPDKVVVLDKQMLPDKVVPDKQVPDLLVPDTLKPDTQKWPDASPLCGNGKLDPGEQCDGKLLPSGITCQKLGYDVGTISCKGNCTLDVSNCKTVLLDKYGIVVSKALDKQSHPAVASNGTSYLVVWQDRRNGSHYDIAGARVTSAGKVLDSQGIAISTAGGNQVYPAVASDGSGYLVVWQSGGNVYGSRVDKNGTVLDKSGISISVAIGSQEHPAVAFDGTDFQVVWQDKRSMSNYDIYGRRVDKKGKFRETISVFISLANKDQVTPRIDCGAVNCLVAWEDRRHYSGNGHIYGARIKNGVALDSAAIPICTKVNPGNVSPTVASDGTDFFVVWSPKYAYPPYALWGARVDSAYGNVLDKWGVKISSGSSSGTHDGAPSISSTGSDYFLAWNRGGGKGVKIYSKLINKTGSSKYTSEIRIDPNTTVGETPSVATNGTSYFVTWNAGGGDIYGARLSP